MSNKYHSIGLGRGGKGLSPSFLYGGQEPHAVREIKERKKTEEKGENRQLLAHLSPPPLPRPHSLKLREKIRH